MNKTMQQDRTHNLGWLTKRPIAHRGLHDASQGVIENTQSAFARAIEMGFAIETDLQLTKDGEAVVFHDEKLDRLTKSSGQVANNTLNQLKSVEYEETTDQFQSLDDLLGLCSGKVPLILEVKTPPSDQLKEGDKARFVQRIADQLTSYKGNACVMSFDPVMVFLFAELAPHIPRGLVAESTLEPQDWPGLTWAQKFALRHLLAIGKTKPHFIAYDVDALPSAATLFAKYILRLPLLTWTVKTPDDLTRARWADQIIFEGFIPKT